jgi:hypothetical protein
MSIGLGDTPQSSKKRQMQPYLDIEINRRKIKEAQEQQYLQSINQKQQEVESQKQSIELEKEQLELEYQRLKKEKEQKQVSTFDLMNALLDEQAKRLNKLIELETFKIPQGKTFPFNFRITDEAIRFDFVEGEKKSYGVPATAYVNLPYTPLRAIIILNDGGSDIVFGTNDTPITRLMGATLKADTNVELAFDYPVIKSLTIGLAAGQSSPTDVRVIGML